MKKIISILTLCSITLPGFCQQRIDGIGDFRLDMDKNDVLSLLHKRFGKATELHNYYTPKTEGHLYKMAAPRNKGEFNPYYYPCTVIETYLIPAVSIAAIPFRNVILLFANDRLLRIETEGSEQIDNAISAKYGQPDQDIETGTASCSFDKAGNAQVQQTTLTRLSWRNDDINAYSLTDKNYDSDCKLKYTRTFVIESSQSRAIITNCSISAPQTAVPVSDSTKALLNEL